MTWNIRGDLGFDWRCDLERDVSLIRSHAPDVMALQEVDSRRSSRAGFSSPAFEFLVEALGTHSAEARLIAAPDGDYGHVVISRWPIISKTLHDISIDGREPRAAIEVTIETPQGPLHLIAAHLGLSVKERRHQSKELERLSRSAPAPSIVLGDFNDWIWRGSVTEALARTMPGRTHFKTFPAWLPVFGLDRIYVNPSAILKQSWTVRGAWRSSDHLPVIADLDLRNHSPVAANRAFESKAQGQPDFRRDSCRT
jgi:endonuclease/exonuclease/phosphatase family metal-dependent hydrolase